MSAPIDLYAPLNRLKPLASDIWMVDGGIVHMSYGPVTLPFPTRMVVVRLDDGGLWLWSPVAPDAALFEAVAALGPVRHIVSPNAIHYAAIPDWSARFPEARVWASPGVEARAADQGIDVRFTDRLADAPPDAWAAELDQLVFDGSRILQEVVFLHRASRTLIVADLIENFEAEKVRSRPLRLLMRLAGILHPNGGMPRDLRLTYLGRRHRARKSRERLLAWAPERIVMAHGRPLDRDATGQLRRAMRWLG